MKDYSGVAVLIVDDTATNRMVAKKLLAPYHLTVDLAASGMDAIRKVEKKWYDLVFLDYRMPGMDGVETLLALRRIPNRKEMPIVALTANGGEGVRAKFLRKGFQDYLPKPIDVYSLDSIINSYLNGKGVPKIKHTETNPHPPSEESTVERILDPIAAMASAGINTPFYRTLLQTFKQELQVSISALDEFIVKKDINDFTICIHGLKSAANAVGAYTLSCCAMELETWGKEQSLTRITEQLPLFKEISVHTLEAIDEYEVGNTHYKTKKKNLDRKILEQIRHYCEESEYTKIGELLAELDQYEYEECQQALLNELINSCDSFEFEALDRLVQKWSEENK
ncbi:Hpt domain-containing response regulator [Eubacterium aggregans]|uniref:Hpt domain-containing response regulator n=1 Tax=Eubacterium aggregans TaxID=81409 RepID=UPI003F396B4C